jgi:hypothetical protein
MGKTEGKRSLGKPSCRWEDNIKMDLQIAGCGREGVAWIELDEDSDNWRVLVSNEIFGFHNMRGNLLTS